MKNLSLIFAILLLASCQTIKPGLPVAEQHLQSSYLTEHKHLSFHDDSRSKDLDVWLWYPAQENGSKRKPLVVLSHGHAGNPFGFHWLIEPLVAAGFIVVATKHSDLPGPQINHWNRALDVSFMLTEVLNSPFGLMIDEHRIGFAGFSLGGMTGMLLAGARASRLDEVVPSSTHVNEARITEDARLALPSFDRERMKADYRDPRIKAAFLMAPAWAWIFDAKDIQQVKIPISIVSGDKDEVVVPQTNGLWFAKNAPHSEFRWLDGAGHFVFLDQLSCEERMKRDPEGLKSFLYKDHYGVNRHYVQEQVRNLALEFFERL
jgi:predicted dienelactone hydrolase